MISRDQIRAARALLGWSQSKLASSSGFTTPSIANIELGKQNPTVDTLHIIQHTLESAGVEFM
ncbi:MAG: helix-turn-helix transcriptional regulator, partial [Bdellovibrionales bacterium]